MPTPRLRFSLRTLFVVVTTLIVVGYWLVTNIYLVRERNSAREHPGVMFGSTRPGESNLTVEKDFADKPDKRYLRVYKPAYPKPVSFLRRQLGDKPAEAILVLNDADFDAVVRLFPEATVVLFDPPRGWPLQSIPE